MAQGVERLRGILCNVEAASRLQGSKLLIPPDNAKRGCETPLSNGCKKGAVPKLTQRPVTRLFQPWSPAVTGGLLC